MLKVSHRHVVFTIPYELRNYFYSDRELIKKLQDGMNEVIRYYYSKGKNKYDVGIITVVYTFGKDIKWNLHVHALIDELGGYEEIELEDGTIEYREVEDMPILVCPNCDADFYYKDDKNK